MVNSDELIGTTECLTLQTRFRINRCRYNRVRLCYSDRSVDISFKYLALTHKNVSTLRLGSALTHGTSPPRSSQGPYLHYCSIYCWMRHSEEFRRIFQDTFKLFLNTSGFCRETDEICPLLACYLALSGNSVVTFRDNLSAPSSRVKKSKNYTSWTC
jgi:hypothetical protein